MDVFWNTIAAYNAATWPVQLLLVAVAAVLTLLLYLRPTRAVRVAMKVFMAALNFWIAGVYYFRFLSVRLNRLKNKLLANYLRNRGNDLATVRNSAFCVAILSNNSFICKYNIFFRKYELSVAIL